jgi:hypothetical protein
MLILYFSELLCAQIVFTRHKVLLGHIAFDDFFSPSDPSLPFVGLTRSTIVKDKGKIVPVLN